MDNLADFPALVSNDLLNGFTISDPDDFHQRYKQNS